MHGEAKIVMMKGVHFTLEPGKFHIFTNVGISLNSSDGPLSNSPAQFPSQSNSVGPVC